VSQENVEIVRRFNEEWASKPDELPAVVAEFVDADCDYYPVRKFPEAVPCHGRDSLAQFLVRYHETWDVENPIRDLIAVGDDRVLSLITVKAEGHRSGIRVEGDLYQCAWLRHGLIFRMEDHLTLKGALYALGLHGETLKAAGLEE
jgi:hypothetical protein